MKVVGNIINFLDTTIILKNDGLIINFFNYKKLLGKIFKLLISAFAFIKEEHNFKFE